MTSAQSILDSLKKHKNFKKSYTPYYNKDQLPYSEEAVGRAVEAAIEHYGDKETMVAEVAKLSGVPFNKKDKLIACKEHLDVFVKWGLLEKQKSENERNLDFLDSLGRQK